MEADRLFLLGIVIQRPPCSFLPSASSSPIHPSTPFFHFSEPRSISRCPFFIFPSSSTCALPNDMVLLKADHFGFHPGPSVIPFLSKMCGILYRPPPPYTFRPTSIGVVFSFPSFPRWLPSTLTCVLFILLCCVLFFIFYVMGGSFFILVNSKFPLPGLQPPVHPAGHLIFASRGSLLMRLLDGPGKTAQIFSLV